MILAKKEVAREYKESEEREYVTYEVKQVEEMTAQLFDEMVDNCFDGEDETYAEYEDGLQILLVDEALRTLELQINGAVDCLKEETDEEIIKQDTEFLETMKSYVTILEKWRGYLLYAK